MVYFIRNTRSGAIKIGVSDDPIQRLGMLQTANSDSLELLGIMAGDLALEASWHERFAPLRIRGEWFQSSPELIAEIERNAVRPGQNVWAECLLRDGCRYGLGGIRVCHAPTRREFICRGSNWDAAGRLVLIAAPETEDHTAATGRLVISLAELFTRPLPAPERFQADECDLLSPWPVVCCSPRRARA